MKQKNRLVCSCGKPMTHRPHVSFWGPCAHGMKRISWFTRGRYVTETYQGEAYGHWTDGVWARDHLDLGWRKKLRRRRRKRAGVRKKMRHRRKR